MPPDRHRPRSRVHPSNRLPHKYKSSAQPGPTAPPNRNTSKLSIPLRLPELNDDVLRTILAHLAANGALPLGPCLFVCRHWRDLINVTNTFWSTIIIDEVFYTYFLNRRAKTWMHPAYQFIRTCIQRSHPAETRMSLDWESFTRYGFDKYGSPRGPFLHIADAVINAVTMNRDDAFKRCRDFTLTWRQGEPILSSSITYGISQLPGLRKFALRNYPSNCKAFDTLLRRSYDTLEEISVEDTTGNVYATELVGMHWTPNGDSSGSFSSLQRMRMFNTRMWGPVDLVVLGTFYSVRHLSLGSGDPALAIDEGAWVDTGHYEGNVLPTGSVNLPHVVSLRVWGVVPDSVLKVLRLPSLQDLCVEQDTRGMTSLLQMTVTCIPGQIKRLRVVANTRFALGGWDVDLKGFLELAEKNLESIMVEKWMKKRATEQLPRNLTMKREFQVFVAP